MNWRLERYHAPEVPPPPPVDDPETDDTDEGPSTISLSVNPEHAVTTEGGEDYIELVFSRGPGEPGKYRAPVEVIYTLAGTAVPQEDYTGPAAKSGGGFAGTYKVTIPADSGSQDEEHDGVSATVQVKAKADDLKESAESVFASLHSAGTYRVSGAGAVEGSVREMRLELTLDRDGDGAITSSDKAGDASPVTIFVNNDDDNNNGVPDLGDDTFSGSAGEDDLVPMELLFENTSGSVTLKIAEGADKVRVWSTNGTLILDATMPEADIPVDTSSTAIVLVEAIDHSLEAGDVTFALSAAPAAGSQPTTVHADANAVAAVIETYGENVTSKSSKIFAGQRGEVAIKLQGAGMDGASFDWKIEGNVVGSYLALANKGTVVPITDADRLKSDAFAFAFNDGTTTGVKRVANVSITLPGKKPISRSTTFDVFRPTAKLTAKTGEIQDGLVANNRYKVSFGSSVGIKGIELSATEFDNNAFPGSLEFVQVVRSTKTRAQRQQDNKWLINLPSNPPYLDTSVPYPKKPGENVMNDSPFQIFGVADFKAIEVREEFATWLMYKPADIKAGAASVMVPLMKVDWYWSAKAAKNAQGVWGTTETDKHSIDPKAEETQAFPEWNANIVGTDHYVEEQPQ